MLKGSIALSKGQISIVESAPGCTRAQVLKRITSKFQWYWTPVRAAFYLIFNCTALWMSFCLLVPRINTSYYSEFTSRRTSRKDYSTKLDPVKKQNDVLNRCGERVHYFLIAIALNKAAMDSWFGS